MSYARPEQISTHARHRSTMQREYKKRSNRTRRRAEKLDPQNAPTHNRYLGYTT